MKRSLVLVLAVSAVIELYLALGVLFTPEKLMQSFGVSSLNNEVLYMAAIIGWFCLVTTGLVVLAAVWVWRSLIEGYILASVLGVFWIGIGLHLGLAFGRPQHLMLDAAKGLIILILSTVALRQKRL